ncbi:MAG TPA: 50S ribosomal protein L37ae [Nanoarchaeota archaeon]|nr:50S ribosomal protein L37ae [Candidatus Woesearchaeota archaeon]HIH15138.1 50S ribosomal protein L37ae [Nanoarchaeota archaeon]HIH59405.1 50S ribosomal protein L37ae [Nanoarchaeota archaeon]HII14308.1 50S ribosomal protein L37ae [Nanoarchaeota archaeon]HIJ04604.1 50S ribosomal protein L37ae [Nanoarchaeota archaeon]
MKTKKLGSVARFGARYGKRTKTKFMNVEKAQKAPQKCPYCSRTVVKRLAAGIFQCKKCDSKFTGKAYKIGE